MSPLHPATHWVPYSVHRKYGRVWEYSEAFGDKPFPQTQSYVRVVASQLFAAVVDEAPGSCKQSRGQAVVCDSHQLCLVANGTVFGSM